MTKNTDIKALEELAKEIESGAEKDPFVSLALDPSDNARVIYGGARGFFTKPGKNRIPFFVKGGKKISNLWIPRPETGVRMSMKPSVNANAAAIIRASIAAHRQNGEPTSEQQTSTRKPMRRHRPQLAH